MKFKKDVKITDRLWTTIRRFGRGGDSRILTPRGSAGGAGRIIGSASGPVKVESNVFIKKIRKSTGKVEETRDSHNIFVDYGRDWLAHLIALQALGSPDTTFRDDRIRYMAVGIGGQSQLLAYATIEAAHAEWDGYAGTWGGGAASAPVQTGVDPSVLGLEWPVEVTNGSYYDDVSAPATFPSTGIVRFTGVLGINEVSFDAFTSVPLSEVGLFTQRVDTDLGGATTPPLVWPSENYAEKAMVAYNTFDTLSKTSAFVLQFDWEIRFS